MKRMILTLVLYMGTLFILAWLAAGWLNGVIR